LSRANEKSVDRAEVVREFIEGREVRGLIREDGGDIRFDRLQGNTVHVCMTAACSTCPAGPRTVKHFVERTVRERFSKDMIVVARFVKPYYIR